MGVRAGPSFDAPFLGEHQVFPRGDDVLCVVDEVTLPGGKVKFLQMLPHLGWVYDVLPRKGRRRQKRMLWPVAAPDEGEAGEQSDAAVSGEAAAPSPFEAAAAADEAAVNGGATTDEGDDATLRAGALPSPLPPPPSVRALARRSSPRALPPAFPAVALEAALVDDTDYSALILEEKCNAAEKRARERAAHALKVRQRRLASTSEERGSWRSRMSATRQKRVTAAVRVERATREKAARLQAKHDEAQLRAARNRRETEARRRREHAEMLTSRRVRHMRRFEPGQNELEVLEAVAACTR
jgi:hypothetical protein